MQFIKVPGLSEVNFVRTGPKGGAPLVLLHPVGLDLTWWGSQIDAFARDHDVVAFDMPGHGMSGHPDAPPSFEGMADVLDSVLDHIDAGPANLVGISVGGMIAQTFALRRPERVRSLALVATLCTFTEEVRGAVRDRARVARTEGMARLAGLSNERWFPSDFRERRPDMLDRAMQSLLRQDPEFHASMWEMVAGLDLADQLPRIACETLVVVGGADVSAPLAAGKTIAGLIPGAVLKELPGLGHFPPFEAPARFNQVLADFLPA